MGSVRANSGDEAKFSSIDAMLNPGSISIVGATDRPGYGARLLNNLLKSGDARLYPVNPNRAEVLGLKCYPSIGELPEATDLAAILVPAAQVIPSLRGCIDRGVKAAMVISAGFAELGTDEGRARQAELRALARESGVRVCGPNCLGIANLASGIWANATTRLTPPPKGRLAHIGLISQSGATVYRPLIGTAQDRGIALRYLVATGNEADLESSDFIQYMLRDPEIRAVAAVIEGFKDGPRFVETADLALAAGKPLILLKVGRTEAGSRGASSHTAAMTGSDVAQDALFRQKGVIRVDDYDELIETTAMFAAAKAPRGKRIGVLSESGGMAAFMADKCAEEALEVPQLSTGTCQKLRAIMGNRGSAANPADLTGFATGADFPNVLDILLAEENQDLLVLSTGGAAVPADTVIAASKKTEKPILFVWTGSREDSRDLDALRRLQASDVPLFYLPGKAAKAARRLVEYHRLLQHALFEAKLPPHSPSEARLKVLRNAVETFTGSALGEHEGKQVLAAYGVKSVAEVHCADRSSAVRAAEMLGYPVVLKIVSPQILHKTEAGGVRLGIADSTALAEAYDSMHCSVSEYDPGAHIDGVLVQRMAPEGIEVIVGTSHDEQFGPVLMLGLGGVMAEALGAVTWRVCPINKREANEMIGEVRGLTQLLAGFRGRPKADSRGLVDVLVAISQLAIEGADEFESLDINPLSVLAEGQGTIALDALIVLRRSNAAGAAFGQRSTG